MSSEQKQFIAEREEVNRLFTTHRALLRVLFKNDIYSWVSLQLEGETPTAFSSWIKMAGNFYSQIAENHELQIKTELVGVTSNVVSLQLVAIENLKEKMDKLRRETGEMQTATEVRNRAFDEIYPLYLKFTKYADILLPDNVTK